MSEDKIVQNAYDAEYRFLNAMHILNDVTSEYKSIRMSCAPSSDLALECGERISRASKFYQSCKEDYDNARTLLEVHRAKKISVPSHNLSLDLYSEDNEELHIDNKYTLKSS